MRTSSSNMQLILTVIHSGRYKNSQSMYKAKENENFTNFSIEFWMIFNERTRMSHRLGVNT